MAGLTLLDFSDQLDEGVNWRRTELLALKNEISKTTLSETSPLGRALLRSGVALLYAHWEGYSKESLQAYLEYVSKRRLKYGELNDGLATTAALRLIGPAEQGDPMAIAKILELVRRGPDVRARLPKDRIVNTKSNLRHHVLVEILTLLGLDCVGFETKSNLIDRKLCDQRNGIAHGRALFLSKEDFIDLHQEVMALIEAVRDLLIGAAAAKLYRMPAGPPVPAGL